MTITLSAIDRVYGRIDVVATLADGSPTVLTGAEVAILPLRKGPTASTQWTAVTLAGRTATVLLAGPDADPTGALTIPRGDGELWIRVTDNPESQAVKVGRVQIS